MGISRNHGVAWQICNKKLASRKNIWTYLNTSGCWNTRDGLWTFLADLLHQNVPIPQEPLWMTRWGSIHVQEWNLSILIDFLVFEVNGANTNRTPGDATWITFGALAVFPHLVMLGAWGREKNLPLFSKKLGNLFARTTRQTSSIIYG